MEIGGQWRGIDGTDVGKEDLPDFSDMPAKHTSMPLTTLTHLGNCRCFRLEREVEQWLEKASPATLRSLDFIL